MIKKGIVLIFCCLLIISFLPVLVFADGQTYYTPSEPIKLGTVRGSDYYVRVEGDCRIVALGTSSSSRNGKTWAVRKQGTDDMYYYGTSTDTSSTGNFVTTYTDSDGVVYEMAQFQPSYGWAVTIADDITLNIVDTIAAKTAYEYTFGDYAGAPVEPVNWGILRDVKYNTAVAGNGFSAFRNVDYINWNNAVDANDNDISECQVEIQAVPGSWTGTTKEDLLTKVVDDFTIGGAYSPVTLGTVSASVGTFSISWQGVINEIGWEFDSLYAKLEGTQWLKNGWYYQIRLLGSDGYIGSWQTVYSLTSGSAAGSENIINHNEFNSTTNSYLQTITQINNQETVTITFNETSYTVENPDVNPEPEGGTDLWDILKQLINGIFQILAKLGRFVTDLVDGLLDMIRNLIIPPDDYPGLQNEISLNIDDYIREKQPALHEFNQGIQEIRSEFTTIRNNAAEGYCILEWQPVYIDLRDIGGSYTLLIDGGRYDFGAAFNRVITEFGFDYDDYKMLVSAVIYILLIWYTNGKIMRFFHG